MNSKQYKRRCKITWLIRFRMHASVVVLVPVDVRWMLFPRVTASMSSTRKNASIAAVVPTDVLLTQFPSNARKL